METYELRIGNYVSIGVDNIQVESIGLNGIELKGNFSGDVESYWHKHEISGIPLTEEWLLRFGLIELEDGISDPSMKKHYKGFGTPHQYESQFQIAIIDGVFWHWIVAGDNHYSFKSVKIDFLHHLQNLYFALTGTELTIKDK